MILEVWSGITSRIYTIIDALNMCEERGEKLTIYWPIDKDCHIRMENAFKIEHNENIIVKNFYPIKYFKPIDVKNGLMKNINAGVYDIWILIYNKFVATNIEKLKRQFDISYDFTPPRKIGWSGEMYKEYEQIVYEKIVNARLDNATNIYIKAHCGIKIGEVKRNLNDIKFTFQLDERANKIVSGYEDDIVGVHIRRTDHKVAIKESPLERFVEKMRELAEQNNNIKFFLATDDVLVQKELQKVFGNRIIVQNKVWGRDSKKGMYCGLIDGLCLSKCRIIYGSYTSVFSHFWAEYGGVELIIL